MYLTLFLCSYVLSIFNAPIRIIKAAFGSLLVATSASLLSTPYTILDDQFTITPQITLYCCVIITLFVIGSYINLASITILIGILFLLQSSNLIITFICLELINISLYVLICTYSSGIKYIITSLILTTFFVLGIVFNYVEEGPMVLWPLLITFFLKLGIFPFHQLTADLYDGLPTKIMMIIQLPIKLGIYLFVLNWLEASSIHTILGLAILIPAISTQYSYTFKRFISLSSSSYQTLLFLGSYAVGYAMANYAIVYIITLTVIMLSSGPIVTALFLSIAGLPPFIGFYFKLYLVSDLLNTEAYWLLVLFLASSLILTANYLERTQLFNSVESKSGILMSTTTGVLLFWSLIG